MSNSNFLKVSMLFMILSTTVSTMTRNKQVITIQNDYGSLVYFEIEWRDENAPHTKSVTKRSIEIGKSLDIKAPISTYKLYGITALKKPNDLSALKTNLPLGKTRAHGDSYFVISKDGNISGFKNKDAYQKSIATGVTSSK